MRKKLFGLTILLALAFFGWYLFEREIGVVAVPPSIDLGTTDEIANRLEVPEGFRIDVFAENVPGARVMAIDPRGRVIVSETKEGKIVALEDADGDGKAEKNAILASGLDKPHGLAFDCRSGDCLLYVAEHGALSRYPYLADDPKLGAREKILDLSKSAGDRHSTRTLLFLPAPEDDILLISVGSSCDVCEDTGMRGKIMAYDVFNEKAREYALGLRNAVFMAIHPATGDVYATEMGRDGLGDDLPPDEVNVIREGAWYGWPWFYGQNVFDEKFRPGVMPGFAREAVPSAIDLPAHSAPLGLSFIPEEGWPEEYWFDLLIAYHGSWNRTEPTGYKVVRAKMDAEGRFLGLEDFITGWLTSEGEKIGRPADVLALPGGVLYITDDDRGAVYRMTRTSDE